MADGSKMTKFVNFDMTNFVRRKLGIGHSDREAVQIDWSASIPACMRPVAEPRPNFLRCRKYQSACSRFTLMQARMPALQSGFC